MKPLNIQERQKAFQRFLLFFILTVAVIVTAIFFGVKIPYAENEKLQEQLSIVDKENRFREDFSRAMAEAQSLLDTVNMDPQKSGLLDGRITQKIQEMDALLAKNDVTSKGLYNQVIRALNNAQSDKRGLRAAGNKDSVVAMYNAQILELKNSLAKWQESYNQLQTQNLILRQK
ncbi:MAG TPA: type VI secretion system TssO [Niabella sp.]|nr:type VI secretion system TssO [Niabella sp.]